MRTSFVLVAVDAVATLAVLAWAGGWFTGLPIGVSVADSVASVAGVVGPIVGMGVAVGVTARWFDRGFIVVGGGVVVLTVLTVGALLSFITSDSSTAALMFVFLPVLQWVLVGITVAVAVAVDTSRN